MPNRQRHDEFIWALIFSLIINLLFIGALVGQRYRDKSSGLQPFVVSLAASLPALPGQSSARVSATLLSPPAKTKKAVTTPPPFQPQKRSVNPLSPAEDHPEEEGTIDPTAAAMRSGEENPSPRSAATGTENTATEGKESADAVSIFGDKITGGNYTAAEYLTGEKPPYPKRAERNGWEGTVLLTLLINANGEVEKVEIAKTSGYEILDRRACESVGAWRFKPARHNGVAIAATVQQPVIFRPPPRPETFR